MIWWKSILVPKPHLFTWFRVQDNFWKSQAPGLPMILWNLLWKKILESDIFFVTCRHYVNPHKEAAGFPAILWFLCRVFACYSSTWKTIVALTNIMKAIHSSFYEIVTQAWTPLLINVFCPCFHKHCDYDIHSVSHFLIQSERQIRTTEDRASYRRCNIDSGSETHQITVPIQHGQVDYQKQMMIWWTTDN